MTETEIKDLLDPLVGQNEKHFTVVFTPRRTRRRLGSYTASLRRITIYERARLDGSELIATALHELAHHLVWVYPEELMTEWRERKRFPSHGRRFKQMLASLLDAFNRVYAERFQGILVLDNREPRYAPRFVQFQEDITSVEDLIAYHRCERCGKWRILTARVYSEILSVRVCDSCTIEALKLIQQFDDLVDGPLIVERVY